ncbi:MAG: ABC transporter permease [Oscillospiraceae bacterium]|nr:ABC transporter permease [Oscillospiraceae bacterium]MBR3535917.1 ABC transporter permease [Oscillospiraceae bacterium]MBR6836744.1 ABC transporter permease [Oscillospiraceae bacterium]
MSITEHIISAWKCLSSSKMRTFLTTLGIIVGISSVILINTIGSTLGKTVRATMNGFMSGNQFMVGFLKEDYMETGDLSGSAITDEMMGAFEEEFNGKVRRQLILSGGEMTLAGTEKKEAPISLCGVSENTIQSLSADMDLGRYISAEDTIKASSSVVIYKNTADIIFGKGVDPIGKQVTLGNFNTTLTVVGTYIPKVDPSLLGMSDDAPQTAIVPYSYLEKLVGTDLNTSNQIAFIADDDVSSEELKKVAEEVFPKYVPEGEMLYTESLNEDLEQIDTFVGVITKIIAAIAAVSLVVGGIGVMNIMLVSVTERTMEIGVRKAMGADNKSIRTQFITESIMISLIGSAIGIVLGLIEAKLVAMFAVKLTSKMNLPISVDLAVPVGAIIGSVIFSFIVGLVFGVYPADKAAKMEVVDALRYE